MAAKKSEQKDIEQLAINTVRILSADAVQKANSGHPGTPMALAPIGHVLWSKVLNYNPKNPHWANRDRFILSAGHACMFQYSFLYLTGYDLTLDDWDKVLQMVSALLSLRNTSQRGTTDPDSICSTIRSMQFAAMAT